MKLIAAAGNIETSASSLVGKLVKHRFEDKGKLRFFKGRVISQVPGLFNIVYDKEPGIVYSFKLSEDMDNGDLHVL